MINISADIILVYLAMYTADAEKCWTESMNTDHDTSSYGTSFINIWIVD